MTESTSNFQIQKKEVEHMIDKIFSDFHASNVTFTESARAKLRSEFIAFAEIFTKESAEIAFSHSTKPKPRVCIREEHVIYAAHKLEQTIGLPSLTLKKIQLFEKRDKV